MISARRCCLSGTMSIRSMRSKVCGSITSAVPSQLLATNSTSRVAAGAGAASTSNAKSAAASAHSIATPRRRARANSSIGAAVMRPGKIGDVRRIRAGRQTTRAASADDRRVAERPGADLLERARPPEVVALGVVDTQAGEQVDGLLVADDLGDRLLVEAAGEFDHRLDHQLVGGAVAGVSNELAVDLQEVEWQVLQVVERSEPRAEVV